MNHRWIAAALLGASVAAVAQTASAPAASPAKKELVARVITLQTPAIEQLARNVADRPALQTLQAAAQVLQTQVPPDRRDATAKSIEADAKKFADETYALLRERILKLAPSTIGPVLEEKFTEEELKQVATWLDSPANKKLSQVAPDMQNALIQKLVAETAPTIDPKLQALRQRVQSQLTAATASAAPASSAASAKSPAKTPVKK